MAAIALCALALVVAQTDESPAVKATGYALLRTGYADRWDPSDVASPALARLAGVPRLSVLGEGNVQLRVTPGEGYAVYADLSLFAASETETTGPFAALARTGNRVVPSELYANGPIAPHLSLLAGRKRLVWGSGFAWNPSDLLDPPKDPTDPALQRAGAWVARLEAPFERFTVTALWAPRVTAVDAGLPRRFLFEPGGSEAEQLASARLYALVADADVNLVWSWSNRYADALPHSHRFAVSFSRYFFHDYEAHLEAIVQQGRAGVLGLPEPDRSALYTRAIAGTRYTFADESLLSLEYAFNGTGLAPDAFRDRMRLLDLLAGHPALLPPGTPLPPALAPATVTAGEPVRFGFEPVRRHYLFAVYQKPRIHEDFTATLTVVAGLEGPSALVAPALSWNPREWLVLSAYLFVPLGSRDSEYGGLPFRARALLEARAHY